MPYFICWTHWPIRESLKLVILEDIEDRYLKQFLWNCHHVDATRPHWLLVNTVSCNGLMLNSNKPLPEPMLAKFCVPYGVTRPQWVGLRRKWVFFHIYCKMYATILVLWVDLFDNMQKLVQHLQCSPFLIKVKHVCIMFAQLSNKPSLQFKVCCYIQDDKENNKKQQTWFYTL